MTGACICATAVLATFAFSGCSQAASSTPEQRNGMNAITWGMPSNGLQLGLSVPGGDNIIEVHLENTGAQPLTVLSHVNAGELHFDWYRLRLDGTGGSTTLRLFDDREQSAAISATLAPGGSLRHAINVADWARRSVNLGHSLPAGTYQVWASYDVTTGDGQWRGHLEAGPVTIKTVGPAKP